MGVALVDRRVGGQEVVVAVALDIPDEHAVALLQDDRQGLIVVRPVLFLERDELLAAQGILVRWSHDDQSFRPEAVDHGESPAAGRPGYHRDGPASREEAPGNLAPVAPGGAIRIPAPVPGSWNPRAG